MLAMDTGFALVGSRSLCFPHPSISSLLVDVNRFDCFSLGIAFVFRSVLLLKNLLECLIRVVLRIHALENVQKTSLVMLSPLPQSSLHRTSSSR